MTDEPAPHDPLLDEFLAAERARPAPPAAAVERLWHRVEASLPPPTGGPGGAPAPSRTLPRAPLSAVARAPLAALSVVSALVGAGLHAAWQHRAARPPTAAARRVVAAPPAAPLAPAAPPAPAVTPPAPPAPPAPVAAPARPPSVERAAEPRDDAHLLERARTALLRHDPPLALAALREHTRQHPHSDLAEEREALTVQALHAAGRAAEARIRAEAFLRDRPTSPFRALVSRFAAAPEASP